MDLSAKRFKEENTDTVQTSPQPNNPGMQSPDDIFISLLDSDNDDDGDRDNGVTVSDNDDDGGRDDGVTVSDSHDDNVREIVSTASAVAVSKDAGGLMPLDSSNETLVSFTDVSSLWFVRKHRHQVVLSGHQLGKDTLLLQVGEPPGNGSVKLEVYQWKTGQHGEASVQLVSHHSIPIEVPTLPEEPGFVPATLPLPLSIVMHQSGNKSQSCSPSQVISSGLYRQLFGPELALSEAPILMIGTPSGEVLYTPIANLFTPTSPHNIFASPLCCLSQVVKGIHPIKVRQNDICDGLVITGGRGKVVLCTEGIGEERGKRSLRIECLHAGLAILTSCTLPPCFLIMSGLKYVKVIDLTLAKEHSDGDDRNVLSQQLNRAFHRASRLELTEVIRMEPIAYTAKGDSTCIVFDCDGSLSVVDISKKALDEHWMYSTASSSAATVKERISAKMEKLRQLEGEGEDAAEKLQKVEGYIQEVNMAMHTIHLLMTGKETAFKVEDVTAIETGCNDSCCVKVDLVYNGCTGLGAGWSLVLSAEYEAEGLHVMHLPEPHCQIDVDSGDGSHGDGAVHSSVCPLEGMPPGSLCPCYLTLPSHAATKPLLLTCTLQYDTSEASKYLGQEPVRVSGVILKKLLSLLHIMQPVSANVHIPSSLTAKSQTTGLKPISAIGDGTETMVIRVSKETVHKCVGSTGNHDNKTLLHQFLHRLAGRPSHSLPLQSIGKDDVLLKSVLPDGTVFWLSAKCVSGGGLESVECICKSHSYNTVMAGTDAVIDSIVSVGVSVGVGVGVGGCGVWVSVCMYIKYTV